jgi:hypothetical protein
LHISKKKVRVRIILSQDKQYIYKNKYENFFEIKNKVNRRNKKQERNEGYFLPGFFFIFLLNVEFFGVEIVLILVEQEKLFACH